MAGYIGILPWRKVKKISCGANFCSDVALMSRDACVILFDKRGPDEQSNARRHIMQTKLDTCSGGGTQKFEPFKSLLRNGDSYYNI